MTSSNASSKRTCPVCGARNSGISLFCAECGSSLNVDVDPAGDTAAIPTQPTAPRHTEPFSPGSGSTSDTPPWRFADDQHADETAPYRTSPDAAAGSDTEPGRWRRSPNGAATPSPAVESPSHTGLPATVALIERQPPGARGFFLGLIAFFLIAVVIALYGWTAWLSADLRDTISGWFDVIG